MTTVAQEDLSRPIWPACPSHGWKTGVHKLTSLPIKGGNLSVIPGGRRRTHRRLLRKHVGMTPVDPGPNSPVSEIELPGEYHIEYHGPYLQGSGFPSVNGEQHTTIILNQLEDILEYVLTEQGILRNGQAKRLFRSHQRLSHCRFSARRT